MEIYYILDASAFINGFYPISDNNVTIPEITGEIKDFNSKMVLEGAIDDGRLVIIEVKGEYLEKTNEFISQSGDILRLSDSDKKLIALALMLYDENKDVVVVSDDYTIQNTLKIMGIKCQSVLTPGIKEIYNWKKVCQGCKKEFDENYPFDDCDVCGSEIFKKRIRVNR